jgi:hypothetical protein
MSEECGPEQFYLVKVLKAEGLLDEFISCRDKLSAISTAEKLACEYLRAVWIYQCISVMEPQINAVTTWASRS